MSPEAVQGMIICHDNSIQLEHEWADKPRDAQCSRLRAPKSQEIGVQMHQEVLSEVILRSKFAAGPPCMALHMPAACVPRSPTLYRCKSLIRLLLYIKLLQ